MAARHYLKEFGSRIAENGYEVIPITPGEKYPAGSGMKGWQKFDGSPDGIHDYLAQGWGDHGVGIKARFAPAVDMDILDIEVLNEIKAAVIEIAGESALRRIGFAPKELWVYRAEEGETWPKVDTGEWIDKDGRKCKVEILADGQQFVAAHIHPDTKMPYQWVGEGSVLNVPRSDLLPLSHEQAIAIKDASLKIFLGHGWTRKSKNAIARMSNPMDSDDPFAAYRPKTQIADEELERRLFLIEDNTEHEVWFQVGMALYHQYDGNQQGFDLWDRWSQGAHNYDLKDLEKRWPTFNIQQKDRPPMTARIILKLSAEAEAATAKEKLSGIVAQLEVCQTTDDLVAVCDEIKKIDFPTHVRELLTGKVKNQWKVLTKETPRIGFIRDLIRYESKETISAPPWIKPWVFCEETDLLYNTRTRGEVTRTAFNAANARYMLTPSERLEGKATPETLPTDAALNLYQIPVVRNRMFMPGEPALYTLNGIPYANSYTDEGIPELPGDLSPVEEEAIQIFLAHFEHIIANERDRTLYLDFITYIVQNPGKRINWAILLQGAEGDGKSYFMNLLKAILGENNVNGITGQNLEEKYNPWAENGLICFVEDVRLHGNNRFDAVNKLKPMITNTSVTIRRMQTNPYEVLNTMNYITTANVKDALPVGEEDSRFFPIFTRFQRAEQIEAFKAANPRYYDRLYATVDFAGAIRQFLLLRQTSAEFNPKARAPKSSHKAEMVMLNMSDEVIALTDTLEESNQLDYSELLLDSTKIADHFMGTDALAPRSKALNRLLSQYGFTLLGRFKHDGEKRQFWSMKPWVWPEDEDLRGEAIRDYLDPEGL